MTNAPELLLIGDPVAHSRSPAFQNAGLRAIGSAWTYAAFQVDAEGVRRVFSSLRAGEIVGVNVTAPHKALAHRLCDRLTEAATLTGAVNTVWVEDGACWGDNTDVRGVRASLDALSLSPGWAVLLGAGGAASAALLALSGWMDVTLVNRTPSHGQALSRRFEGTGPEIRVEPWARSTGTEQAFSSADVIVHAASAPKGPGAFARYEALPFDVLRDDACALDLNYADGPTPFLAAAGPARRSLDGATMLLHQGCAAFERWTGARAPVEVMRAALAESLGRAVEAIG
jgi:shikimate dehydrogenase